MPWNARSALMPKQGVRAQMIFRLKMKLRSQVRWHVPACGGYRHMPDPAPLEAKLLTLLLPSPVALEVRLTLPVCSTLISQALCHILNGATRKPTESLAEWTAQQRQR